MAFPNPPRTWSTQDIVTFTQMNEEVRDALRFLKGLDGEVDVEDVFTTSHYFKGGVQSLSFSAQVDDGDDQNAWELILKPTGDQNITGLTGGAPGRVLFLRNESNNTVTLKHEDASSAAANRFFLPGVTDLQLGQHFGVVLVYGTTRWRALSVSGFVDLSTAQTVGGLKTFTTVPESPSGAPLTRIATGTYTGDGATSQGITGVSFQPKQVIIANRETADNQGMVAYHWTSDAIVDDNASGMSWEKDTTSFGWTSRTDGIISLDADGFTVDDAGGDEHPNKNSQVYNYIAIG